MGQMWYWYTVAVYSDVNVCFCVISDILAPKKRVGPFLEQFGTTFVRMGDKKGARICVSSIATKLSQNLAQININSVIIIYLLRTNQIYEFIPCFD